MANSLTSIDPSFLSRKTDIINNIKAKIYSNGYDKEGKTFKELFREKLNPDGSVNENKLDGKDKKLFNVCRDMESLLWKQVLNEMKKTINQYRLTEESQAENVFSDFLYDEYAGMISRNSNTCISDEMFKQLSGYK